MFNSRERRKERLMEFQYFLKKMDSYELERCIATYCLRTGLREKVVREYLKILQDAGIIIIENNKIKVAK